MCPPGEDLSLELSDWSSVVPILPSVMPAEQGIGTCNVDSLVLTIHSQPLLSGVTKGDGLMVVYGSVRAFFKPALCI